MRVWFRDNAWLLAPAAAAACGTALLVLSCHPAPANRAPRVESAAVDTTVPPAIAMHAETGFPLRGAHAALPCESCHGEKQPDPACQSCHASPHDAKLERPCESCHTAGMPFSDVSFKHPDEGVFAAHRDVPCLSCHRGAKFLEAPPACASCHADFHKGSLGNDCQRCHRSDTWSDVRFDHNETGFPLVGAHRAIECGDCHRDLQSFRIVPRPTECLSCHEQDYRSSRFPHAAYAAGTNCQECHMQDTWSYAHSPAWFNIQTGHHAGASCAACHPDAGDYREYTCHSCHAGHSGDNGGRCLDCHPGGFPGGGGD